MIDDKGIDVDTLNVTKFLGIDRDSLPITGFWEPLITAVFIPGSNLFISVYHRMKKKLDNFNYSYKERRMLSEAHEVTVKDCTTSNFPIKTFYSPVLLKNFTFFR